LKRGRDGAISASVMNPRYDTHRSRGPVSALQLSSLQGWPTGSWRFSLTPGLPIPGFRAHCRATS